MRYKLDETLGHEAMLLGRVTYEGFAKAWSTMTDEVGFADKMNSMPKYVVSHTLTQADWNNATLLSGDLAQEVTSLKEQHGGDILVHGSASLVRGLTELRLVDEYRLMTFPIVLGEGRRLFEGVSEATTLNLVDVTPLKSGTVIHTYHPAGSARAA